MGSDGSPLFYEIRGLSHPNSCVRRMCESHSARGDDPERILLRTLLELYQDMPVQIPTKESNDVESYRRLEEVMRYSNKELKMGRG